MTGNPEDPCRMFIPNRRPTGTWEVLGPDGEPLQDRRGTVRAFSTLVMAHQRANLLEALVTGDPALRVRVLEDLGYPPPAQLLVQAVSGG